ncbi:AfsA-related hotdog domain-containing protein [Streptomyces griseorubiginosus]|uniref:AfsA-related hotdog domain-containing protein n=1 Tax=Streptomyces griseorubiginosus TaxID=67304 RepID=UPI00331D596F
MGDAPPTRGLCGRPGRLRNRYRPARWGGPCAPNVLLSPTGRPDRRRLRVDTAHPVFFGHPLDHVPGMLLLAAARQAARAHGGPDGPVPASFHAAFHQFTEVDGPVWIEVSGAGGADVQVVAGQGESVAFECRVGAAAG